jgi:hypothetical protein
MKPVVMMKTRSEPDRLIGMLYQVCFHPAHFFASKDLSSLRPAKLMNTQRSYCENPKQTDSIKTVYQCLFYHIQASLHL